MRREDQGGSLVRFGMTTQERLQRRALREALGHAYTLNDHLEQEVAGCKGRRGESAAREITDGVIYIRGRLAHAVTRRVAPERVEGFTDEFTDEFVKGDLTWLPEDALHEDNAQSRARRKCYAYIAETPVLSTLLTARDSLTAQLR